MSYAILECVNHYAYISSRKIRLHYVSINNLQHLRVNSIFFFLYFAIHVNTIRISICEVQNSICINFVLLKMFRIPLNTHTPTHMNGRTKSQKRDKSYYTGRCRQCRRFQIPSPGREISWFLTRSLIRLIHAIHYRETNLLRFES